MTPCGYDGSNFQYIGSRFYALDLWGDPDVGYDDQSEIDNEIYVSVPHRIDVRLPLCSYEDREEAQKLLSHSP